MKEDEEREVLRSLNKKKVHSLIAHLKTAALEKSGAYSFLRFISVPKTSLEDIVPFVIGCPQLTWLDVHSNFIEELPTSAQFQQAKHLRILNLHNNGIFRVQTLNALTGLKSLHGLTLYNCPIADRSGYRHHVVNTIWTLKALDHHVLSDEEIIEDAKFTVEDFKPLSKAMKINLCPAVVSKRTFQGILNRINYTFVHYSPVVILQRFIRGHLARKRLKSRGVKVKMISCKRAGRNLLSPHWKLRKGEVEINYKRLIQDDQNRVENVDRNFMDQMPWPDLQTNDLDTGLHGKTHKIRNTDPLMAVLSDMKRKEISEKEQLDLSRIRRLNAEKLETENLAKQKAYREDKEKVRRAKSKTDEFLARLSRSLDAARAVDAAYAYKERQNKFGKLVELNNQIRSEHKQGLESTKQFREDYRLKAKERRNEREIEAVIASEKREEFCARVALVKQKVAAKAEADKRIAWNKKNAQKFSEYYNKLEKELIRYNVEVNRTGHEKRRKNTMDQLKAELIQGKKQMKNNQQNKLDKLVKRNRIDQNRLDKLKRAALERQEARALASHRRIKSMSRKTNVESLPIVAPI